MKTGAVSPRNSQIVCHECSNVVSIPALAHKQKAICPRCGYKLAAYRHDAEHWIAALSIAALILLGLSLPFEFLSFSAQGQMQSMSIPSGLLTLANSDYLALAIIQTIAIIVLPMLVLTGLLFISATLLLGIQFSFTERLLNGIFKLVPWSMAEIFIVGVLVSLIKIISLADVTLGLSFYAYIGFTLCMTSMALFLDKHQLANQLQYQLPECAQRAITAKPVNRHSVQMTWALLFTALILYVPANFLPMMHTRFLGSDTPSTILGGVVELWHHGSYPVAAVIFVASVFVPVAKMAILIWLNYSVQKGFNGQLSERVFWYRVTEFIGRWSMVDVFVVAILVSLIQLGNTMSIYPGPAVLAFCGVVVCTMFAAITFDTRLIWQGENNNNAS